MKYFIDKQTYQSIVAGSKHLTDNNQLIVTGQTFPAIVKCNNKTFVAMSNVVMQVDNDVEDVSQLYWVPNWQTFKTSCKPSEFEMHCRFEDALRTSVSFAANFELHCMQQYLKLWNIDLGFDKSLAEVSMPMLLKQLGMLGSSTVAIYDVVGSKGDIYQVKFDAATMHIECNCKAYQFRKTCKHCQQVLDGFATSTTSNKQHQQS